MIKKLSILLLLFCAIVNLNAQVQDCETTIETTITNPVVQVGDFETTSPCSSPLNAINIDITDIVTLGINFNHPDFIATPYLLEVDVEITQTAPTLGTPITIPLTIEYSPFDKQTFKDKDAFIFNSVEEYQYKIIAIKVDGNSVNELPTNAYIEGKWIGKQIVDFTSYANNLIQMNAPIEIDLDCDAQNIPEEIEISWQPVAGAIEYQLEWAFINDYEANVTANNPTTITNLSASTLNYDFKHNSTRITTTDNSYILPLLFERGYLIYRVRAVGKDPSQLDKWIYGVWNTSTTGNVSGLPTNQKYQTTSHENLKNWQVTTNFAEEGKKKEVISYFDGSLRNRQSVTKINSDENVIVGETVYDHQGRAAVSILPVPVLDGNCPSPTTPPIKFYPNFNQNQNNTGYNKNDFDIDVADCETAVEPMLDGSGASRYYSPNNPKQDAHQQFVPDAHDYPFTVIEYTPDNTGRIRRQSGVGEDFKLGSGHETKFFYGKPDQLQIDRLFGSEVGYASHYKKNMVIDANNQISASYLDQEGRVIATSLAGNPPTNVEPVPSQPTAAVNLTQEMILPTAANTTAAGKVNQMIFNETFLVTTSGPYEFNYQMATSSFEEACLPDMCFNCIYDLTIKLTDDCGVVLLDANTNDPIEFNQLVGNFTDNGNNTVTFNVDCNSPNYKDSVKFITQLPVGNYNIVKTLTINEDAINFYLQEYLNPDNNNCIKTLEEFEDEFLAEIDTNDCNITCESCAEALGIKEDFVANNLGTAAEYDMMLEECLAPCKLLTMCETTYEMLLADVSPGGQYGKFLDANNNINVGMYWLSVYNTTITNALGGGTPNWKNPKIFLNNVNQSIYVDEFDNESFIQVTPLPQGGYAPAVDPTYVGNIINNGGQFFIRPHYLANLADFVGTYWQDSWAQSLVQYHPEYCYYQQCLGHMEEDNNNLSSELFDAQLRDFTFNDAVVAGYLNGNTTNGYTFDFNSDPFISFIGAANHNTTAANELVTAFNNSYVIDGQMRNMEQVAAYLQKCGNAGLTVTPSPITCFSFGANDAALTQPQNDSLRELQWITLVAFYLEKKNKIINTIYDQHAIQNCESFNDCIGSTSFNPFDKNFVAAGQHFNPQQPCSYQRKALYKYKQKRFLDESDMGFDPNTIAYQMYAITGQCPVAFNFQNVLNELAATGNLTATNFNFNSLPSTSGLLTALSNNNPLLPFPQFTYDAALSGNTLKFTTSSPNAASCETTLTPVSGSFNWNDVIGFIGLDANGLNAPNYTFTVYAKVDDGNGGFTLEEINGETCMNILNCNFNRICSPNELAEDIQMLLSFIASEGQLTTPNFLFGSNPNYLPFITTNISNLLPNTANITWNLSPTLEGTFSDGTNTISLQFSGNPNNINPAQISFFNNINVSSTGNNVFTMEAFDANGLNLGTLSGTATIQAMGSSTELELGSCENPPLVDCETPAHQNLDDFFNLLKTEMLKNPFAISDLEDIMQSPAMTQGLISYFGTANNVTTTVNETIDCDTTSCLTTLELIVGDCEITMSFESNSGLSFADFYQFNNFVATGELNANAYFGFMFDAAYVDQNGTLASLVVNGSTTCIPLNNCETCIDSTRNSSIDPPNTDPRDTVPAEPGPLGRETDTTLALMPTLEAAVDDVNTRLSLTSTDSAFVEAPTYNQIMGKGAGAFVQHYIRFINNFNPEIDDSIYLHRFDKFIADFGKTLSINKEYKRYTKAVKIYNIRANNLSLDTLEIVSIDNYAANRLATGCNTYINHVDTCLQNNTSEAANIMSFMVENNMIDTTTIDSNKLLYTSYVTAFEDFKTNHPLAKHAESYLKMASFQETEKNNLYFNNFAKAGFTAYINTFADTTQLPNKLPFYDTTALRFGNTNQAECIQQYFQLVDLLNNYNNSSYAQINNHQLPIPLEEQGVSMCECLSSYMAYISPYLEVPANQNLTLPLPLKDPDCTVIGPCVEFNCKAVDPCKQAFKDYQAGVLAYNQMIADSNLANAMITETYSAAEFEKRNLCGCVPKFRETVGNIRDTVRAGSSVSFPSTSTGTKDTLAADGSTPRELDLVNICADLPCGPDSVSIDTVPEVTIPYVNPCVENMINTALANAANAHQQYIDSLSQDFIIRYRDKCTNYLSESFTKKYGDAEYHFTLYYYDQAGNLIKTIPPEGVDIVPTTSSSDNLSLKILADRGTNTKNFYTNHRMETKYLYNSLNQLTRQTLPDHDNMDLIAFQGVNGLPTNLHIEESHFVTPSKGFLVGWINQNVGGTPKDRGLLYTTNNGGANWTRVNDVVAADINAMQWTTTNDAYAVGNNGVFLASKDAGFSWDMINLYTANVTVNLNDLYLDASGNGLLVGDNLTLVDYQNGVPAKSTLTANTSFSSNATITAIDADVINNIYYLSVYDPANNKNYICYNTIATAISSAWTIIDAIRVDDLTAVSTIDNSAAVVAGNNGLLLKTTDNGINWIVTETNTRANFEHIYFKDANNGVAIINQHLYKTTNGGSSWTLMDASLSYNSLNLYENDGNTARLMAGCNGSRVVKVFINNNGIGHEPKFVDATPPVVTLNDAYAVPNGNNLIVVAVSNTDMYVTHNFNLTNPTWSKTDISTTAPNINQLRFVKGSGNHLMGLGIDNNGALFEFEYDPNKDIVAPIDSLLKITNPALSSFTDIQLLNTPNTFALYNQTNNTMNHFTPTFGASAPTPTFGSFTNTISVIPSSLPTPTTTRLFSVQPTTDNVLMIDLAGDINQLTLTAGTYAATSTTNNVRVEKINDVVVTQAANIAAVTNNGKMLSGNSNQLVLKVTPTIENLNALDKVDVSNNTLMAGNNGSLVLWNGTNFIPQTTNTTNNLLAIDKQNTLAVNQTMIVGESGTILYTSDYTSGNYTSITTAESGSINTVTYNDNGKLIAGADFSHVLFGGNATVVPTKQVFTDRLTGVHFSSINNGTVVGKNYTVRSTNNSGTSFGIILPSGGFTSAIPMELNATFTANDRFIVGEQNYIGRASAALATTVTVPGTAATNSLNDISIISGGDGFIVGGDAANNAVAYETTNGGNSWSPLSISTNLTVSDPNAVGLVKNNKTLNALHHFTNNSTFIAVGKDNTVINYNSANGAAPTEITVLDISLGTAATVNFNDVDFYDNQLGYIVGDDGQLFRSDIVTWNNGIDLEIDNITWEGLSISDNILTQTNDIKKDIYTISVASRFSAFLGGDYDATAALQTYARLMRDESNEISSKFFYDRLGRLVISQNSKQFGCSPKKYSYTIYDILGRIVQVGEKAENTANMTFADIFGTNIGASYNPNVIDDAKLIAWLNETTGARTQVTQTYYDKQALGVIAILPATFTPNEDNFRNRVVMVCYEDTLDNDTTTYNHATHYSYDIHGNVKTLLQDNKDLTTNTSTASQRFKRLDYFYDLVSGNVNKVSYQTGESDQWHHKYSYDADNRIKEVLVSDNNLTWSNEARYFYYDHGPLARIELGDNNVQGTDYAYTLQGWLKNVNSDALCADNDMGKDGTGTGANSLFARDAVGFSLHYHNNDYQPIAAANFTNNSLPVSTLAGSDVFSNSFELFNGNIRAMVTTIKKPEIYTATTPSPTPNPLPQATAYKYDQLNRLITAAAFTNIEQDPNQTTFNQWANTGAYDGRYYNHFTYDANGNILTQQRKDEDGDIFDDMIYQYAKDGGNTVANRLYHVNDDILLVSDPNPPATGKNHFEDDIENMGLFNNNLAQINNGSNNYMYDPIGNLIADKQEEIHKINWNVYGKIKSIIRMAGSLKKNLIFEYDANGNRIAKHQYGNMTPNSSTINFDPAIPTDWEKSTYYTRDAQGNVMAIYEYTIDDVTQDNHYTLTERNIYGSSRLGNNNAPVEMIATTPPNPSQYSHHIGYRQYELSNHLGNVLAVLSDRKIARDTDQDNTVDYYEPDVLLTFDYSPFGAPLHARSFTKEVCDEVTSTLVVEDLNTDFNNGTSQQWAKLSSTTNLNASTGRLEVYKQGGGAGQLGVQQSIMATSGYVYDFTITIENAFTSNSTVVLEIIDPNNTVIYTQSVGNGNPNPVVTFTHQFTASATGTYLIKVYRTGNQSNGSFFIDDALITHEEELTQTLCEDFAGYRYGFNGQEKDNEIKGAGNSYDYGFRVYDARLGRFLSVDPLFREFPWYSPYQFAGNKPIVAIDLDGLEEFFRTDYRDINGNLYKTELKMVSTYGADKQQQTVHHTTVTVNNDGSVANSTFDGSTQGTTTGVGINNAFLNTFRDPQAINLANQLRRNALQTTPAGTPFVNNTPTQRVRVLNMLTGAIVFVNSNQFQMVPASPMKGRGGTRNVGFVREYLDGQGNVIGLASQPSLFGDRITVFPTNDGTFDFRNTNNPAFRETPLLNTPQPYNINLVPKLINDRPQRLGTNFGIFGPAKGIGNLMRRIVNPRGQPRRSRRAKF